MEKELKKIKKAYGENFMKLCRELFPTILENEGELYEILSISFSTNSQTLYADIVKNGMEEEFKNYIYSKIDVESEDKKIVTGKTPYELLDDVGYNLYECNSEEEIQSFKKYYRPKEELCTFNGGRLDDCVVFFAVRKDVEDIKREDFDSPKRQDKYGTSVMSIQFSKQERCTVSIKNRYNHRVNNPDATYGNNLDNIVFGLEQSFANLLKERGLELNNSNREKLNMPGYTVAGDGKYYKYNREINGIYYCPGNIIIENGVPRKLEKHQELVDYFIIDSKNKTIELYDKTIEDSFPDSLRDLEKIEIVKDKENGTGAREIVIKKSGYEEPITIGIDKHNKMRSYENSTVQEIGDSFCEYSKVRKVNLPNAETIGRDFMGGNEYLEEINMPKAKEIGDWFCMNSKVRKVDLPNVEIIGNGFMEKSEYLREISMPNARKIGDVFCRYSKVRKVDLPKVEIIENSFMGGNHDLEEINMPKAKEIGEGFCMCSKVRKVDLPNVEIIEDGFMEENHDIEEVNMPCLRETPKDFLNGAVKLRKVNLPNNSANTVINDIKGRLMQVVSKNENKQDYLKEVYNSCGIRTSDIDNAHEIINNQLHKNMQDNEREM